MPVTSGLVSAASFIATPAVPSEKTPLGTSGGRAANSRGGLTAGSAESRRRASAVNLGNRIGGRREIIFTILTIERVPCQLAPLFTGRTRLKLKLLGRISAAEGRSEQFYRRFGNVLIGC